MYEIDMPKKSDVQRLQSAIAGRYIAYVERYNSQRKNVCIKIMTFDDQFNAEIDILVKDSFAGKRMDTHKLISDLSKQYMYTKDSEDYYIWGVEKAVDASFLLVGEDKYLILEKETDKDGKILIAFKEQSGIKSDNYIFSLVKGKCNFLDKTAVASHREETQRLITENALKNRGYLNIWEKYSKIDIEYTFEQFNNIGIIHYSNYEILVDETKIRIDINPFYLKRLKENIDIKKDRIYLIHGIQETQMSFSLESYKEFSKNDTTTKCMAKIKDEIILNHSHIYIDYSFEAENFLNEYPEGCITLCLKGKYSMLERQLKAREIIMQSKNPMIQLAGLIEGMGNNFNFNRPHIDPLSPKMLKSVFKGGYPTEKQKEAISVALNTPDIAIIQGPPGTGKTKIITAIMERLAEEQEGVAGNGCEILITAFQHVAVENVTSRARINGFPVFKADGDNSEVDNWIIDQTEKIIQKHSDIEPLKKVDRFKQIKESYMNSPNSVEMTINCIAELESVLPNTRISMDYVGKLAEIKSRFLMLQEDNEEFMPYIKRLPQTVTAMGDRQPEDDLTIPFERLLYKLKAANKYSKRQQELQMLISKMEASDEVCNEIREFKNSFVLEIKKQFTASKFVQRDSELSELLNSIEEELGRISVDREQKIIQEYLSIYENFPYQVKEAIARYALAIGATNQGAVTPKTLMTKNGYRSTENFLQKLSSLNSTYKTIIADEAARSSPLDLFIPMSLASERIILVGDHKQLPHIVESALVKQMEKGEMKDQVDLLEISLFEYLWQVVEKLEQKDGIQRRVTLDKQYRTTPLLGNFVSKSFYEGKVSSPLPAEHFNHNILSINRNENEKIIACAFINVPAALGAESGKESKTRAKEAEIIAKHIYSIIDTEEGKKHNFGIITYYREQVIEIYKALVPYNMAKPCADEDDEWGYEITEEYKYITIDGKTEERLHIGTVDAFQGKEFEAVYLSIVRCNKEKTPTSRFGHLMRDSRVCVSLSRQKKLIIAVGDAEMISDEAARKSIPVLYDFYHSVCKSDDAIIIEASDV